MRLEATDRWRHGDVRLFVLTPEHATAEYVAWLNDPQVNRFLESRFTSHDVDGVRAFVQRALDDERVLLLGIDSIALSRHVGNIKMEIDRHHGRGEIGIMIGDADARGRGVGTSAIRCLTDIAAHELGLRRLTAGCYAANTASVRAFEKVGFHVEARRPAHYLLDGRADDMVLLGRMLR